MLATDCQCVSIFNTHLPLLDLTWPTCVLGPGLMRSPSNSSESNGPAIGAGRRSTFCRISANVVFHLPLEYPEVATKNVDSTPRSDCKFFIIKRMNSKETLENSYLRVGTVPLFISGSDIAE